jgi:hypothetical protein
MKKIHVSAKRMKQIEPMIRQLVLDFSRGAPFYITFINYILDATKADPELYEERKRLDQEYDHTIRDGLIKFLHKEKLARQHHYTYFEFRHRDEEKYEIQKLEWKWKRKLGIRRAKPDGWKTCCILKPSGLAEITLEHKNWWLYKSLLNGMDTNAADLDEDERRLAIIYRDLYCLLIDMGCPKNIAVEKLNADILELKLRRECREAVEEKGLKPKPDYSKFDDMLDEVLHRVFRSDAFRQMKLKLSFIISK